MMNFAKPLGRWIAAGGRRRASGGPGGTRPVAIESPGAQLRLLVRTADALRDRGDSSGAAAAYHAAVDLDPGRTDLMVQLGNMLKDSGRPGEAEAVYRAALVVNPADADTHLQLGHALKLLGQRAGALAAYRQAADLDPAAPQAVAELAAMGEAPQLEEAFHVQLRAGGTDALIGMSQALLRMRSQLDEMIAALPDARSSAAFPVELYDIYRESFDVPAPLVQPRPGRIAVILPVDGTPVATLHAQVAAFLAQSWPGRVLHAVGSSGAAGGVVARAAAANQAIEWLEVAAGLPAAEAELAAARRVAADWIVLLAPGAVLHPHALAWIAAAAELGPAAAFMWDEESGRQEPGRIIRSAPILRQAVDYDTLLEANVYGGNLAIRYDAFATFAAGAAGPDAPPCRSALLLHLCRSGGIGHIPLPLAWSPPPALVSPVPGPDAGTHAAAVAAHLSAQGVRAHVAGPGVLPGSVRVDWQAEPERLHVIIPTRDNADDVAAFVRTLRDTAAWGEGLAVTIVDNGGRDPDMARQLQDIAASGAAGLERMDAPFNWSQLNNRAVRLVGEPIVVFANDDMRMLSRGWDQQVRGLLQRPEVGAVGARLIYADETIQHAGVLTGWRGSVIHDGLHEPMGSPGAGGRLQVTRAVSAVTGAFLATRRATFLDRGGFDETSLPVSYGDVDFCLKLRSRGQKVLWTPRVTLVHHESKTRGLDHADPLRQARNDAERRVFEARWAGWLDSDPGVNPAWHDATLPFRLLSWPSAERVRAHIVRCAAANPWAVAAPARVRDTSVAPGPRAGLPGPMSRVSG